MNEYARAAVSLGVGPRGRRPRAGPENDLVERFLAEFDFRPTAGTQVTVFREPKLQSGFPDLVAVRWHEATAERWSVARASLLDDELRLLHYLTLSGSTAESDLRQLHFRGVASALERLAKLALVRRVSGQWRAAPLSATFAVRSILAFEAKVSSWAAAIEQAALNRWFASESYVLVPRDAPTQGLTRAAASVGVGVWVEGSRRPLLRALRSGARQPVSYASWLFNDWSWRKSLHGARMEPER